MPLTAELIRGLTRTYPFHLVFDETLRLVHVAPRYERLTTTIRVGALLSEVTRLERPATELTFAKLMENTDLDVLLRCVEVPQLQLHGRLIALENSGQIVFLGTPWVSSLAEIAEAGMSLADFPAHDLLLGLLTTVHAKDMAMADAQRLANELRVLRRTPETQMRSASFGTTADAERLAGLGRLVASMAHEISTPLGVARISASLLGEQRTDLSAKLAAGTLTRQDLRQFLQDSDAASGILVANLSRIADMVGNFRQVAIEPRAEERRTLRLVPFVEEVLQRLEPVRSHAGVHFEVRGDRNLTDQIYPVSLARLLTTLVENAVMHAYEGIEEPRLCVEISTVGDDCVLSCEDNGVGIGANVSRIFEPFFTTRRMGGGTGLGLYIAHNIARDLFRGGICAESILPHGCRIVVRWPATRVIDP